MTRLSPLLAFALACGSTTADPSPSDTGSGPAVTDCGLSVACTDDCADGPQSVSAPAWWHRLSETPTLTWAAVPGAVSYEISVGRSPGATDVACWTDVGPETTGQHAALWGVIDSDVLYANGRAVLAQGVTASTASSPWTVDIQPPEVPATPDDSRTSVDGTLTWSHDAADVGAGFSHFEVRIGTAPGSDDVLPWTDVGQDSVAVLEVDWKPESWHWAQVRALDLAGNASQPATSEGFISCPPNYLFVPGDATLGNAAFCVARYEMRITGLADGNQPFDGTFVAESRPDGTPWVNVGKTDARLACDSLDFGSQLLTTRQWQSIARSIERTPENWSGGLVGAGAVNRGHSDRDPFLSLGSQGSDPCVGTNNPSCEDPTHADFDQKRTHVLANGEVIWDFAGNVWEQVDGSLGGPDTLWVSFDHSAFNTDKGWESFREQFGPEGPYTEDQSMGRMYGGTGNLVRGGCFDHPSPGVAGAQGLGDMGIYAAHHNTWNPGDSEGFRCAFTPM